MTIFMAINDNLQKSRCNRWINWNSNDDWNVNMDDVVAKWQTMIFSYNVYNNKRDDDNVDDGKNGKMMEVTTTFLPNDVIIITK